MRPDVLTPLFASVTTLKGVGPKVARKLAELAGERLADLLWHLPREVVDRSYRPTVAGAEPGRIATIRVRVEAHDPPSTPRRPYRVRARDATGTLTLIYFHADAAYLGRLLPVGASVWVSGKVELFQGAAQMPHPDYVAGEEELDAIPRIEPVYPLTHGLAGKTLAGAIAGALARAPELPEWLDPAFKTRRGWPDWLDALRAAHRPRGPADLAAQAGPRARLAYDEVLASQLAIALMRRSAKSVSGRAVAGDGRLRAAARAALPFAPTGSQETALREIAADMAAPARMLRLLQGDVGSGKTVVALLSMLNAVEAGGQAVLMAPTEILARQHFDTLEPLCAAAGVQIGLLTGRDKGKARKAVLAGLADGSLPVAVGTHALFQDEVAFRDLMLAVVDEQHRFGVHQRLMLSGKGKAVDLLVMTATPIPRTLMLVSYGDLDVSRLTDKPAGRQPVDTRTLPLGRLDQVVAAVGRALQSGARVYWVCPLVAESESLDLAAAEDRFAALAAHFGEDRVALLHGRMGGPAKDAAMARFADGRAAILVATTVIEVGVDVPEATVMVIEHAERFGLAQLHQLRGRVGRGSGKSTCLLLYGGRLSETARARLETLRATEDGFVIAEEDLRLRGAGEVLGARQSGLPKFRLAELEAHGELMAAARDDARLILERDPDLTGQRGRALRVLLYLFDRDRAALTLRSG